jgi:hypothetical protein
VIGKIDRRTLLTYRRPEGHQTEAAPCRNGIEKMNLHQSK